MYAKHNFVPAIPQSEVLANFFQEIGEKCGEILAKFSSFNFQGKWPQKIHEKSSTFSTVRQIKFFHCCSSGGWEAQHNYECLPSESSCFFGRIVIVL